MECGGAAEGAPEAPAADGEALGCEGWGGAWTRAAPDAAASGAAAGGVALAVAAVTETAVSGVASGLRAVGATSAGGDGRGGGLCSRAGALAANGGPEEPRPPATGARDERM